jgi:hypothetical protein
MPSDAKIKADAKKKGKPGQPAPKNPSPDPDLEVQENGVNGHGKTNGSLANGDSREGSADSEITQDGKGQLIMTFPRC